LGVVAETCLPSRCLVIDVSSGYLDLQASYHNRYRKQAIKGFDITPEGIRKTGGPKLMWEDDVMQDIRALGARNW
jgi:hypothetical protein